MKLILAIIQPHKLEAVKEALNKVEVFRLTLLDCRGFGRQKGHSEVYRGHELTVQLLNKVHEDQSGKSGLTPFGISFLGLPRSAGGKAEKEVSVKLNRLYGR